MESSGQFPTQEAPNPGGAMSVRNRRRRSFMRAINRIDEFERSSDQNHQVNRGPGAGSD